MVCLGFGKPCHLVIGVDANPARHPWIQSLFQDRDFCFGDAHCSNKKVDSFIDLLDLLMNNTQNTPSGSDDLSSAVERLTF